MNIFLEHFQREVLPKLMASVAIVVILTENSIDSKLCLELGAAILLDKPIVVISSARTLVPASLTKLAHTILIGDAREREVQDILMQTLHMIAQNA